MWRGVIWGLGRLKKSSEVTAIPSIGEVTWVMGLTSLVITAPESSAAIEMVPPVCSAKIFLNMWSSLEYVI